MVPKNLRVTLKAMMDNIIMGLEFDPKEAVLHHAEGIDVIPSNKLLSSLAQFPYVNGGLFANEDIEIPQFTDEIRNLLLEKASADNGSENKEASFLLALIQDQLKIFFHHNIKNGGISYLLKVHKNILLLYNVL